MSLSPHAVTQAQTLGPLVSVHLRTNLERTRWLRRIGWALLIGVPCCLFAGCGMAIAGIEKLGLILLFTGALLILPTMFLTFLFTLSEDLPCLAVYEQGIAFENTKGFRQVTWNEIAGIAICSWKFTNSTNVFTSYRIDPIQGPSLLLKSQIERFDDAIAAIQQRFAPVLAKRIADGKRAGQPLPFGAVSIEAEGIRINTLMWPWKAVVRIELKNGFWVLTYRTGTGGEAMLAVPVGQIQNYHRFEEEIADRLLGNR